MNYSADDILLEREQRVQFIEEIMQKYNMSVIFIRVNYPGINKNNELTDKIMENIDTAIFEAYKGGIIMKILKSSAEGPTMTLVLKEEALEVKRTAIRIEDGHKLGRCVDIDVYDPTTTQGISRSSLSLPTRRCYLCEDTAHNCVRARKHSETEVIEFIRNTFDEFMKNNRENLGCNFNGGGGNNT